MEETKKTKVALLALWDKAGSEHVAKRLIALGYSLLASDGTTKYLREQGFECANISDIDGEPILDHRVATLSRKVYAAILADRTNPKHLAEVADLGLELTDLVFVTLYPLLEEIAKPEATLESVIAKTDIGGPTLLRAAAKARIPVATSYASMKKLLTVLESGDPEQLEKLVATCCRKVFQTTSAYDLAKAEYLGRQDDPDLPSLFNGVMGELHSTVKAENAWQRKAGIYIVNPNDPYGWDKLEQLHGPPPSQNNWNDAMSGIDLLSYLVAGWNGPYMAAVLKHGQPCGVGMGIGEKDDFPATEATKRAMGGNPRAAFGGTFVCTFKVDIEIAEIILRHQVSNGSKRIMHNIVAPAYTHDALALLGSEGGRDCRIYRNPELEMMSTKENCIDTHPHIRYKRGSIAIQPNYDYFLDLRYDPEVPNNIWLDGAVTYHTDASVAVGYTEWLRQSGMDVAVGYRSLPFARAICGALNSNTIVLVKDGMLIGAGAGQVDRVTAAKLAIMIARDCGHDPAGAIACSDSFFPFPDGMEVLAEAGVRTIWATRGSVKDELVFKRAKELGVLMVTAPDAQARGFRH